MIFASYIFLFVFLPLFLVSYAITPARWRSVTILAFSLVFYGWWRAEYLLLLAFCLLVTYWTTHLMMRASSETGRKSFLTLGVGLNVAILLYFKYANFAVLSLSELLAMAGSPPLAWTAVLLPVGLSFFTFQAISYIVDVYRKTADEARSFVDFAAYITMFPQLIAGPIVRFHDVALQMQDREHSLEKFGRGAYRFMIGFSKKILIADAVAPIAAAAFAVERPSFADSWLGLIAYTAQLYFDFSGYSDMAIGLGLLFGFEFPENFNAPYVARSISEFWRRWHITLSTFLREYIYIPLGGNRTSAARTRVNLILTMVLGGAWHGANWTFVLWGAWHGMLLMFERSHRGRGSRGTVIAVARTSLLVMVGWVLFRCDSLTHAARYFRGLAGLNGLGLGPSLAWQTSIGDLLVIVATFASLWLFPLAKDSGGFTFIPSTVRAVIVSACFLWAVATLAAQSFSPFLYYQF